MFLCALGLTCLIFFVIYFLYLSLSRSREGRLRSYWIACQVRGCFHLWLLPSLAETVNINCLLDFLFEEPTIGNEELSA